MDLTTIIVGAAGWAITAGWGVWLWHHKRKAAREPEKVAAELRLLEAQTEKLRTEKLHLDAQIEQIKETQRRDLEKKLGEATVREERNAGNAGHAPISPSGNG